jgi:catechol 2,3-dioxygenase-like lactoylglutathione lyase family enzyme
MEQRLSLITLGVAGLDRSVAFYQDVVGWRRAAGPPEIAFFDLGGLVLSLYPHDELAKDLGLKPWKDGDACQGFALAHNVRSEAEVDAIFARLTDAGAIILKAPEAAFWGGYSGYFADPDGHAWEIAYNPYWSIGDDGRITMTPG